MKTALVQYSSTYIHTLGFSETAKDELLYVRTHVKCNERFYEFILFLFCLISIFFGLVQQVVPPSLCSLSGCSLYGTS